MKKSLAILLLLSLLLAFSACQSEPAAQDDSQLAAHIEVFEQESSIIEYISVTGLSDRAVQEKLNANLESFFTWILVDAEEGEKIAEVTAQYEIVGERYLSIRAYDFESYEGAAHPTTNLRANTYDLETGEAVSIDTFIADMAALNKAAGDGTFAIVEPSADILGAPERLQEALICSFDFFLLQDGIGLRIDGENHATGDYWTFVANYETLDALHPTALSEGFKSLLQDCGVL